MSIRLPELVTLLCYNYDAWIVGSAANPQNANPRDYDILVPYSSWGPASSLIPKNATVNSFGGWKVKDEEFELDIWPGELSWILKQDLCKFAWHPSTNSRWSKNG